MMVAPDRRGTEFRSAGARLEQAAEKLDSVTSAAKASTHSRAFTAALKALRHPKPEFFRSLLEVYAKACGDVIRHVSTRTG